MSSRTLTVVVTGNTTGLERAFGKASTASQSFGAKMQSAGKKISSTGKTLTRDLTLPIVAVGVMSAKMALDFETSMNHVQALTGASARQTKQWGDQILSMSKTLPIAPQELAKALYFVASAGVKTSQVMPILKASAEAAAAGLGDTATVAQLLTSAMNAYGPKALSAKAATDVLVEAVKVGKAEPADLAMNLGKVIPIASAMGVKFSEVAASVAELTNTGLSAAEATTAVRAAMVGLLKPSSGAATELTKLGFSVQQVQDRVAKQGLNSTLQLLAKRIGGNRSEMAKLFPNVRALTGFLALTGKNAGNVSKALDLVTHSTGATDTAFKIASQTAGFKMKTAFASLQATAIQLGAILLPVFASLAKAVGDLVGRFSTLSPEAQKIVVVAGLIVAALGPLLVIVGSVATVVGFLADAFIALAAGEWLAAGPITLIVVGVLALGAALIYAWRHSETFRAVVLGAFHAIQSVVGAVVAFISAHWRGLLLSLGLVGVVILLIIGHWRQLQSAAGAVIDFVKTHWKALLSLIPGLGPVLSIVAEHFSTFRRIAYSALHVVESILSRIGSWLNTIITAADNVASAISNIHMPNISFPHIPGTATGGIVTRPQVRLVGEAGPEAIIPLSRMHGHGGLGGGVTIIMPQGFMVGTTAQFANEVRRALASTVRTGNTIRPGGLALR